MPSVSEKQRRAMFAAAAGKSNIGIPQSVGKEFTAADKGGKLPMRAKKYQEGGEVDSDSKAQMRSESTERAKAQREAQQIMRSGKPWASFDPRVKEDILKMERAGPYAMGGYVKGGNMAEQLDRPRGGPALTTKSRFIKQPDVFRTSIEEQDYDKPKAAHKRPSGGGKQEEEED